MFAMLDGVGVVDWMTEACLGWTAFDQAVQGGGWKAPREGLEAGSELSWYARVQSRA